MKKQALLVKALALIILNCAWLNVSAQNLQIKGYVFGANNAPVPSWPVSIVNLPGTASFSVTVYTNSQGFYSATVSGGGAAPFKQWRVSTFDQCAGTTASDTVSNCNGYNASTVTPDGMVMRTDTAFNSCITNYINPTRSTATWSLTNWATTTGTLSYTVTNINVTASNYAFSKQELCTSCSSPTQTCYYTNIYNDALSTRFADKYYDVYTHETYFTGITSTNKAILMKTDRAGNVVTAKQFSVTTTSAGSMARMPNGDFLFGGTITNTFYIMRLSPSMNVIWAKEFSTSGREWFPHILKSTGDTYIVGSWHSSGGTQDDLAFMKIDGNGNILWTKLIASSLDDELLAVSGDGFSGCLFTGRIITIGSKEESFLGNLDANGNTVWLKKIIGSNAEVAKGIVKTYDGGYALNGKCGQNVNSMNSTFFMKVNSSLGISWVKKFDGNSANPYMPSALIQDSHGSYYISANTAIAGVSYKAMVVKYDVNGNYLWAKTLDYMGDDNTYSHFLTPTRGTPENIIVGASSIQHPQGTGTACSPGFTILNTCTPPPCNAAFSYTNQQYQYTFFNNSAGNNLSYSWNFGDGTTSTSPNPVHTFNPGTYNVCLVISNSSGCLDVACSSVQVQNYCNASFTYSATGTTAQFTSNFTGVVSSPAVFWTFGDGSTSVLANPVHTYPAPGTYTACVHITETNGCQDSYCDSVTITNPVTCNASFTYTVSQDTVFFQSTSTGNNLAYYWQIAVSNRFIPNPILVHPTPGTYWVGLEIRDTITSCFDSTWQIITVPSYCDASFTFSESYDAVNNVDSVYFDNTSTGSNLTYIWDDGRGNQSNSVDFLALYPPGVYTPCLTVSDTLGCSDTFCDTITVTGPPCNASFIYSSNQNTFSFRNFSTGGAGLSYIWDFGDGNLSLAANPTYTYSSLGTYIVCLVVSDNTGCSDAFCDTISVTSNPPCNASFTTTTFAGNQINFFNTSANANSFSWDFGDGTALSTQANPSHIYLYGGTYNACLYISNSSGCQDTFCNAIVITSSLCSAAFTYTTSGSSVTFLNASASNQSFTSVWNFGDGSNSSAANPTHGYTSMGDYNACLRITSPNGCTDVFCDTLSIVYCVPSFSYAVSATGVSFTNTSFPSQNLSSFWAFGDGTFSTQANPMHVYPQNGTYQACLTIIDNSTGCSNNICQNILINNPVQIFYCVSGRVTKGGAANAAFPATVFLVHHDSTLGTLTAVASTTTNLNGAYQFCGVSAGKYLVKAALNPGAVGYTSYLPTYYGNSLFWNYATEILVNNNIQQIDIWMIAGTNPGGPGFIGGYVSQGANKSFGPGDPLEGVQVMLLDLYDNPVQYTYSNALGRFSFSNVAYGVYKVYAEVTGKITYPYVVKIGPDAEVADNIMLLVESTQVISDVEAMGVAISSIKVYPNPVDDVVNVELSLPVSAELNIIITDITGKTVVEEILHAAAGSQTLRFDLSEHAAGVYLLRIFGKENIRTFKLVKQ